ncbi:hypothetical protein [Hymenobacter crusticola]|uniref:hypothetical protein n=1 Tax=Hymenobacter crusticola TaxID=1770526 RepID=UPI001179C5B0|nr:hypothetical protein [Hymenobacter crusticola]
MSSSAYSGGRRPEVSYCHCHPHQRCPSGQESPRPRAGPTNLTANATECGLVVRQQNAQQHLAKRQVARLAALLHATGLSLRVIAQRLNESRYRTRRGKFFYPMRL